MTRLLTWTLLVVTVFLTVGWDRRPDRTAAAAPAQAVSAVAAAAAAAEPSQPSRSVLPPPAAPDPGELPQTRELPRTDDAAFRDGVEALWQGIVNDEPAMAMPFYFPQKAYVQLKDIGNAAGDYSYRLKGYFDLDVHAAHALLGGDAAHARLIGADVPTSNAEWMWPGSEENKIPYYRVYGTRVRYEVGGHEKSFGIFSMLSWRGRWYAIHFGPWPRWVRVGAVDDPRG